ncbi:polysaccharide pyruvyl transferase family protein [Microbacterium arborescens]
MKMPYLEPMRETAYRALDELIGDLRSVVYVDFPDHANVGDSAIALGMLSYLEQRKITVTSTQTIGTHLPARLHQGDAVLAHGGGNLGDLYPSVTAHRKEILAQTPTGKPIIQAPQTAHFANDAGFRNYIQTVESRVGYRIGARDNTTFQTLQAAGLPVLLAPDSAHILGRLRAPTPSRPFVVISRTDDEKHSDNSPFPSRFDWLQEPKSTDIARKIRNRARLLPLGSRALNLSTAGWKDLAQRRVTRGLEILGQGEIVVTDRLHAMLLGLQAGRTVIAVDNSYGKVHGYIDTWLKDSTAPLYKASSFLEARKIVENLIKS